MKNSMQFAFLGALVIVCAIWSHHAPAIASMLQRQMNNTEMKWVLDEEKRPVLSDEERKAQDAAYMASIAAGGYPVASLAMMQQLEASHVSPANTNIVTTSGTVVPVEQTQTH